MDITITIPPSVEEHLRTYTASLFYETSPYAMSRAIVCALVNQLDASCLVSRDEVVTGILESSKPQIPKPPANPIIEKELPAPAIQKSSAASAIIDPKKLKVPQETFQGSASNTWLVWGWCMASSLNLVTIDSGARKFHSFGITDVIQGVIQKKKVKVKDTTAYSALDVLEKRQWLNFNRETKLYTLSSVAQKWALTPKNQIYLIEKGFLDPIEQPDQVIK